MRASRGAVPPRTTGPPARWRRRPARRGRAASRPAAPVTTRSPSDAASASVSRPTPPFGFTNIGVGVPRRTERIAACEPRIRLPCEDSHASSSGNVARADSESTSPAYNPARSGATAMSVASSPRRRRNRPPNVSSTPSFRFPRRRSMTARRLPARDRPGQRNTSPMSPGIPNGASFGKETNPRSVHRYAPLAPGVTSSPAKPSSRQRSTAHGLRATNESAPVSRRRSPTCVIPSLPPGRSAAS